MNIKCQAIVRLMFLICLILLGLAIFKLSSEDGQVSLKRSGILIEQLGLAPHNTVSLYPLDPKYAALQYQIRKSTHFMIYAIFGILAGLLMLMIIKRKYLALISTIVIGAMYATSDEFHQSFISGRTPRINDVCIDTAGVLCGAITLMLVKFVLEKVKGNNINK